MYDKTKKKYHPWAVGITVFYLAFMLWLFGYVIFSKFQKDDVVTDDYYAQGIQYQHRIDTIRRTQALPEQPTWKYDEAHRAFHLFFPDTWRQQEPTGTLTFYRPSDADQDYSVPLEFDHEGEQVVNLKDFAAGLWRIQISWQMEGLDYFSETIVVLK